AVARARGGPLNEAVDVVLGEPGRVAVLVQPQGPGLIVDPLVENVEGSRTAPTYDVRVLARTYHLDLEVAADHAAPDRATAEALRIPPCRRANGYNYSQS